MQLETVKVVSPVSDGNPNGYIVINKTDLTDEHELFDEGDKKKGGEAKGGAAKALTVEQLKEALTEKGISIPDGAKKADLQVLLDKANEE